MKEKETIIQILTDYFEAIENIRKITIKRLDKWKNENE